MYAADSSSPLLGSKNPHTLATHTKPCGLPLEAAEGPEVHQNPLLWMSLSTSITLTGERSGHKNLALEGLGLCSLMGAHYTHPSSMPAAIKWATCLTGPPARLQSGTPGVSMHPLCPAGMGSAFTDE